ncbi:MAG: 30S ribosomal protein S19 [Candidatus Aenigmarchaeota archaeon]|nr:30S ribosomal protein S19 [Candidatus Aenigmarchaeota archaeon]
MAKIFTFKGKTLEEIQKMSLDDFIKLIPSRERRHVKNGLSDKEKKFLEKLKKSDKPVRTHLRDMVIIPQMIDARIMLHSGKDWQLVTIKPEMLGHRLGEFVLTRRRVMHSAPGVGATRASKNLPLK